MSRAEKDAIESMELIVKYGGDNLLSKEHRKKLDIVLNLIKKLDNKIKFLLDNEKSLKEMNRNQVKIIEKQQKEIERIKSLDIYKLTEEWETGQLIHKDKIREFIKKELPDDEIMKWNIIYDVNGIDLRMKLEELLEEN